MGLRGKNPRRTKYGVGITKGCKYKKERRGRVSESNKVSD